MNIFSYRAIAGSALWALASIAARPAAAQTLDRSQRPVPGKPTPFRFPTVRSHVLRNGLRVIVVEDRSVPVVAVRAVIAADSTDDPAGKEGLFDVTLDALREGTTTKSAEQIALASSALGTAISPTAFTTITPSFEPALALMGEMLMHPRLDSAGIHRRKAMQAAAARSSGRRPFHAARTIFYSTLYGADDPLTRSLDAPESSVAAITTADVADFYRRHVAPAATTIIVTGDVSDAGALAAVRKVFGAWTGSTAPAQVAERRAVAAKPAAIHLHDVPGNVAYIYIGAAGPARTAPDAFAAEAMSALATSALSETLREKRGMTYSVSGGMLWHALPHSSEFLNATQLRPEKVDSALVLWLTTLRDLQNAETTSPASLEAAQQRRLGLLPAKIDGPDSVVTRLVEIVRDRLPLDYFDRYVAGVTATTADDVAEAASRYVDVDRLTIVVTGDRKIIEPALRAAKLGPVIIVDEHGRPL
jgi:zinc protease